MAPNNDDATAASQAIAWPLPLPALSHCPGKYHVLVFPAQPFLRKPQTSPCPLLDLPPELKTMVFNKLGPTTKRILGSTSKAMYDIWKDPKLYQKDVKIHIDELFTGSYPYIRFITNWILHNWPEERAHYPDLYMQGEFGLLKEHIKYYMKGMRSPYLLGNIQFKVTMKTVSARIRGAWGYRSVPVEETDRFWTPTYKLVEPKDLAKLVVEH